MIVLSLLLGLLAVVLLLPTLSDLLSLVRLAARKPVNVPGPQSPERPRFLLLVPAHDEELLLPACLASLARLRYPPSLITVVVIADNCTDRTAELAQAAGVQCLIRTAPVDRGKPQAIAWALAQLPVTDYDAFVIVDADTELDPDFAACAAARAPLADKVLQPFNGVSNDSENALTRMAAVLSEANHGLAYVLKTRAGLNVPLGAGMCVGTRVLAAHGWTVRSLSEDWELYALLTVRGARSEEIPAARIRAQEATTLRDSTAQRGRWTAGKLAVLFQYAGPLLRSTRASFAQKLDGLAELSAPGPVLHLALVGLAIATLALIHPPGAAWVAGLLLATLVRPALYACIALARDPAPWTAIRAFAFLPFYAIWRIGAGVVALGMLRKAKWVRTARRPSSITAR
jgi:cellulose synthase/poly-beta-1,6-N-acetylglucosamine synthase-like glycosyltransferase